VRSFTWAALIEHVTRVILVWFFIKWWGFHGLFWAFSAAAVLKAIFVWPVMAKYIIDPVFSVWQTFLNPHDCGDRQLSYSERHRFGDLARPRQLD